MKGALRVGVVLTIGTLAVGAWAAYVQEGSSESWSGVAGVAGPHQDTALVSADYMGLRALKLYDFDQRACALEVSESGLNGGTALSVAGKLKVCEPKAAEAWKNLDVGFGHFITSLEVCLQKVNDEPRLRGIRVQAAAIGENGALKPVKDKTEIVFAGCTSWQPKKVCGKGKVATGVRASYSEAAGGYTGLELRCHALKPAGGSTEPPAVGPGAGRR